MDAVAKSIVDNIDSYNQLWKNHKLLRQNKETKEAVYQISKWDVRVWYIKSKGRREVIKIFKKENHKQTPKRWCSVCGKETSNPSGYCDDHL